MQRKSWRPFEPSSAMYRIERIAGHFWRRPHQELLRVQFVGACSSSGKSLVCLGSLACLLTGLTLTRRSASDRTGSTSRATASRPRSRTKDVGGQRSPCPPTTDIVPIPSAWTTCRTTRLSQLRTHMPQAHAMAHPHDRPQTIRHTNTSLNVNRTMNRTRDPYTYKQHRYRAPGTGR